MSGFTLIVSNYNDNTETVFNTYLSGTCIKMDVDKYSMREEVEETFEVIEFKCLFDAREYVMNFLVRISSSDESYPITLRSANYKRKNNVTCYFNIEHGDIDYYRDNFFKKVLVPHEDDSKIDITDMCDELMSMKI